MVEGRELGKGVALCLDGQIDASYFFYFLLYGNWIGLQDSQDRTRDSTESEIKNIFQID